MSDSARLLSKVRRLDNGCWEWIGRVTPTGYGAVNYGGKPRVIAHRAVYAELVGPIPDGMTIDHLCHTRDVACGGGVQCFHRRCVNPEHLEPVSGAENTRRGGSSRRTHCPSGHPYSEENTSISCGRRVCKACKRKGSAQAHAQRATAEGTHVPALGKTHCKNGHALTVENIFSYRSGWQCRICVSRPERRKRKLRARKDGES